MSTLALFSVPFVSKMRLGGIISPLIASYCLAGLEQHED